MSIAQAQARLARVPFATLLGMTLVETTPARTVLTLPFQAAHANAAGPLNGGASASLLLMAGMVAAWTDIDLDTEPHLSCVDMSIQYLAAAREEDVLAEAQVVQRGRDLFFLTVALRTPAGKPICQGVMTYRAPDYAGHAPRLYTDPVLLPDPDPIIPPDNPRILRGYVQKLHMAFQHQSPGRTRLCMPCTAMHMDERGQLHPGALASITDLAGTAAAWSLVLRRPGARGATIGMHISYTSPTTEPVVADAHVQQRSEELFFSTVHVTGATTGQLVALGTVTYRLLEPRDGGVGQ
jgi:uncharacterized protein (TIGR00369 family)